MADVVKPGRSAAIGGSGDLLCSNRSTRASSALLSPSNEVANGIGVAFPPMRATRTNAAARSHAKSGNAARCRPPRGRRPPIRRTYASRARASGYCPRTAGCRASSRIHRRFRLSRAARCARSCRTAAANCSADSASHHGRAKPPAADVRSRQRQQGRCAVHEPGTHAACAPPGNRAGRPARWHRRKKAPRANAAARRPRQRHHPHRQAHSRRRQARQAYALGGSLRLQPQ